MQIQVLRDFELSKSKSLVIYTKDDNSDLDLPLLLGEDLVPVDHNSTTVYRVAVATHNKKTVTFTYEQSFPTLELAERAYTKRAMFGGKNAESIV